MPHGDNTAKDCLQLVTEKSRSFACFRWIPRSSVHAKACLQRPCGKTVFAMRALTTMFTESFAAAGSTEVPLPPVGTQCPGVPLAANCTFLLDATMRAKICTATRLTRIGASSVGTAANGLSVTSLRREQLAHACLKRGRDRKTHSVVRATHSLLQDGIRRILTTQLRKSTTRTCAQFPEKQRPLPHVAHVAVEWPCGQMLAPLQPCRHWCCCRPWGQMLPPPQSTHRVRTRP